MISAFRFFLISILLLVSVSASAQSESKVFVAKIGEKYHRYTVSLQYEGNYKAYQDNELLDEGEFAGQAKDITMVWEFLANEVKATGGFNMTMEYDWTPGLEFTYPVAAAVYEGSWSVDGSKMTFHFKTGEVSEADIISETEDTLVLSLPQTMKQSGFGGENVFTMVNTMTLKRK